MWLVAADLLRRVADEQQVPIIEEEIVEVLSDRQMKCDPLHQNPAGHAKFSLKIFDALMSIGYAA
ncbi:MAG: hypothetical protein HY935_05495 [Nitrosomonadales bacterium]|nr:hypothetical protein [Nitrosomonadales bacterium]